MENLAEFEADMRNEVLSSELSTNTRIAYQKGWKRFLDFCTAEQFDDPLSVTPDNVARFFVQLATRPSPAEWGDTVYGNCNAL